MVLKGFCTYAGECQRTNFSKKTTDYRIYCQFLKILDKCLVTGLQGLEKPLQIKLNYNLYSFPNTSRAFFPGAITRNLYKYTPLANRLP